MGSTNMDSTEYVVTYRIEFERPRKSTSDELLVTGTYEFFRGPKEECYNCQCVWWCNQRYKTNQVVLCDRRQSQTLG